MKTHNTSKEYNVYNEAFCGRYLSISFLTPPCIKLFNLNFYRMKKKDGYGLITSHVIIFGYGVYFSWYIKH